MSRKVYLITDEDFELLTSMYDRDPITGLDGCSSSCLSNQEIEAHSKARRFLNYQVRTWIQSMKG